jgi:hypothetical protein
MGLESEAQRIEETPEKRQIKIEDETPVTKVAMNL